MEQAIAALPHVIALDRKKVRQRSEQRFSDTRMAKDYVVRCSRRYNRSVPSEVLALARIMMEPLPTMGMISVETRGALARLRLGAGSSRSLA